MTKTPEEELESVKQKVLTEVRQKVRRGLFQLTAECLGSHDLNILTVLGVDAKEQLLQIFLEETNLLLQEEKDAGT